MGLKPKALGKLGLIVYFLKEVGLIDRYKYSKYHCVILLKKLFKF